VVLITATNGRQHKQRICRRTLDINRGQHASHSAVSLNPLIGGADVTFKRDRINPRIRGPNVSSVTSEPFGERQGRKRPSAEPHPCNSACNNTMAGRARPLCVYPAYARYTGKGRRRADGGYR